MKELEYSFDDDYIFKMKKLELRKQLILHI